MRNEEAEEMIEMEEVKKMVVVEDLEKAHGKHACFKVLDL